MSNLTTDGCVLNIYAGDVLIYTSVATSEGLQLELHRWVDNIYKGYFRKTLTISKQKSAAKVKLSEVKCKSEK